MILLLLAGPVSPQDEGGQSVRPYCLSIFGCERCSIYGCAQCLPPFFMSTVNYDAPYNFCLKCSYGCALCDSLDSCTTCMINFTPNQAGGCECQDCHPDGNITCQPGTYNDFSLFTCVACPRLLHCYECVNGTACSKCSQGSYLARPALYVGLWSTTCQPCPQFCQQCELQSQEEGQKQTLVCKECIEGFDLSEGTCTCDSQQFEQQHQECPECSPNTYPDGESCAPCLVELNCLTCVSRLKCSKCNIGFFMTLITFDREILQLCLLCPPPCSACINNQQCTQCIDGTENCFQNPCSNATANCSSCVLGKNHILQCLGCSDGFYLTANTTCQACGLNCQRCQDSTTCIACKSGYYQDQQACLPCDKGCQSCLPNGMCVSCDPGFFPSGTGICLQCAPSCLTCQSASGCSLCKQNMVLEEGLCEQKSSGVGAVIGLSITVAALSIACIVLAFFIWK